MSWNSGSAQPWTRRFSTRSSEMPTGRPFRLKSLEPISEGHVEDVQLQAREDLTFSISFDVQPVIDLERLGGFTVTAAEGRGGGRGPEPGVWTASGTRPASGSPWKMGRSRTAIW